MKRDKCMIPKIIHYCWFGGNPLTDDAKKCIVSWKKYFPEYEIKEWNESNFDVNSCNYVREAYSAKKWAFVSDYARFWILYKYGGLYFDTDVEVIKSMDDLIEKGSFMGEEAGAEELTKVLCNPGLGFAAESGLDLYKEILEYYQNQHFINPDGTYNLHTVVERTTEILKRHGFKGDGTIEHVDGVDIYPSEYFCPMNYITRKMNITCQTRSIHHYSATWQSTLEKIIYKIELCDKGKKSSEYKLRRLASLPFRVINKYKKHGMRGIIDTLKR